MWIGLAASCWAVWRSSKLKDRVPENPIAEADVYLAYGRKNQAIGLLKRSLAAHPDDQAIKDKLVELEGLK
jgi:Tfp pilus assembly protein FimV